MRKQRTINELRRIVRYRKCAECGASLKTTQGVRRAREKVELNTLARAVVKRRVRRATT